MMVLKQPLTWKILFAWKITNFLETYHNKIPHKYSTDIDILLSEDEHKQQRVFSRIEAKLQENELLKESNGGKQSFSTLI